MSSLKKVVCTVLFYLIHPLAFTLSALSDRLGSGATGKPVVKGADIVKERADVLSKFVILCLQRVDELTDAQEASVLRPSNRLWQEAVKLQDRAVDLGVEDNLLEIFGRCEASKVLNDLRRALREEQTAHDDTANGGDKHRGMLVHRLSQATGRLSLIQVEVERMRVQHGLVGLGASTSILETMEALLSTEATPHADVRKRLQAWYEEHPERQGTLRFTGPESANDVDA